MEIKISCRRIRNPIIAVPNNTALHTNDQTTKYLLRARQQHKIRFVLEKNPISFRAKADILCRHVPIVSYEDWYEQPSFSIKYLNFSFASLQSLDDL